MAALGSLVVKLGLEYAQFTGGLDKSEQAALAASKKVQDTLDGIKHKAANVAGAIAGSLVAAFTVGAFKNFIGQAINAADEMSKMAQKTGIAVEEVAGLQLAFRQSGNGAEAMQASIAKLSKNMADGSKAFGAMGINVKDADGNLKTTRQTLGEVADKFASYADGAEKTALAQELFGKSGADLIPLLNAGGQALDDYDAMAKKLGLTLDDKTAKSAEAFNDTLDLMGQGVAGMGTQIAAQLLPTLNGLAGEFFTTMTSGDKLKNTADFLASAMKGLYVVGLTVVELFSSVGKTVGGTLAVIHAALRGDFTGAMSIMREVKNDISTGWTETLKQAKDAWNTTGNAGVEAMVAVQGAAKKTAPVVRKLGAAAKAAADEFEKLRDKIVGKESGTDADFIKNLATLQKAYDTRRISLQEYLALADKYVASQKYMQDAEKERARVADDLAKTMEAYAKAEQESVAQSIKAATQAELELATYGMLKSEVQELTLAQLEQARESAARAGEDVNNIEKRIAATRRLIAATRGLEGKDAAAKAAVKAADEWQKTADSINNSLTDALMRGFESGKGFAKNMRDTVVNMFKTMVLRPIISAVVNPVAGALTGAMGLSGAAQAAGGISTAMSGASFLGNAAGILGGAGTAAGYGASALFAGNGLGALSGGFGMLTGGGGLGMAAQGAGMIAGVLGPIALGVGAVMALVKKLDDSGTMHTGALSQYSAAGGRANSTTHGAFGMGFGGVDYSAETEKFTGAMAQSIVMMLDSTATTFGKEAGYKAATAFADDTSKDGAWGGLLITKLNETIVNWDPSRTSKWAPKEFADGAAGRDQYLAAVAADVRVALNSIGLPAWATGMLDRIGQGATIEQLAAAVDQINAGKAVFASFAQYMPTFAGLADAAVTKLIDASGGLGALAVNMSAFVDGFYSDAEKLAVNTDNVRMAMAALGFELPTTRDEYRALVQAQMALGEAGAPALSGLLRLSGAFAGITPIVEEVTESVKDLTGGLEDYIRRTVGTSGDADYIRGLASVGNSDALRRLGVPGYASGGYHAGGLRLVGENGPELEVTGPSNIISNPMTQSLLSRGSDRPNARLESLVAELLRDNAQLRAEVRAVVTHTAITARTLKRITPDGDAIQTRKAAAL